MMAVAAVCASCGASVKTPPEERDPLSAEGEASSAIEADGDAEAEGRDRDGGAGPRVVQGVMGRACVDDPCQPPEPDFPAGYVETGDVSAARSELEPEGTVYRLDGDEEGAVCRAWNLTGDQLAREDEAGGRRVEVAYRVERRGSRIALFGPSRRAMDGEPEGGAAGESDEDISVAVGPVVVGCAQTYAIVGRSGDGVILVPGVTGPGPIRAYHPDDAETWYTSRSACEGAAAEIGARGRARVDRGC